jgi:hypothetical protein
MTTEHKTERPDRIWAFHCPFNRHGVPVLGNFGGSIKPVVILPMATWTKLCREIPELGQRQFDVGTDD